MRRIIPGHIRAVTWVIAIGGLGGLYIAGGTDWSVLGVFVSVFGAFFADQATHLAQEDHSAKPPTSLERLLQRHRWLSVTIGVLLVGIGTFMIKKF